MKNKVTAFLFTVIYVITALGFSVSAAADKSALQYIYDANIYKESSEFSEKSFEVFMEAMTAAETILNDADASQEDVDEAVRALTDAVNGLNYYKRTDRTVTKDTWVTSNSGNGGKNFGSDAVLNGKLPYDNTTSTARQIFLGFDISGIDPEVSTVTLRTYMVKNGSNGTYADTEILLYGSSDTSWDESKITWNNRPNKSTMTAVCSLKPGDVVIEENDSNHRWIEFDVTDYAKQLLNDGAEEATFMIGTHNVGSAWIAITSKEDSRGNGAQLVFESGLDKTIGGMMDEDLNDINIEDYIEDIAPDRISQSLKDLPDTGKNGYTITWKSSNPDIMSDAGEIVKLPDAASPVTMTASIESDGITHKKDFELVVLEDRSAWSDTDYIEKDLNDLKFSDFCTQDSDKIVSSINLPEYLHADDGVTFTWDVTNKDAANIEDYVARFTPDKKTAVSMELVVTAKRGTASKEKRFPITLICAFGDNIVVTKSAKISATSGTPYSAASSNFETYWESDVSDAQPEILFDFKNAVGVTAALLCERGNNISAFEICTSDNKTDWKIVYSGNTLGDKLREPIELPETSARYFKIVITGRVNANEPAALYSAEFYNEAVTDKQSVEMDKSLIVIPSVATSNITLPTVGKNGSKITWSSSNTSVISDSGVVTPAKATQYVVLTATITKGDVTDTVSGDVKVPVTANISYGGSGGGGGGGSTVAPPKNSTYVPPQTTPAEDNKSGFNDIDESHWAYTYVTDLVNKKIISEAESFRPEDRITREEFLKLLIGAMNLQTAANGADFNDVDKNEWYYPYICTAVNQSIVTGMDNGNFGIGMPITRQDMAVMAKRALDKAGKAGDSTDISRYGDRDEIADYAKDAAGSLTALEVMNGSDGGVFKPYNNATRAEAAKIISVLYGIFNS